VGGAGADDKDVFRNNRLRALVAETLKLCAKAAALAPGASEPVVLQTWALMVAGNVTAALQLCEAERLLKPAAAGGEDGSSRGKAVAGTRRDTAAHHQEARPLSPEMWVICGRALHLCGRTSDARRVLKLAMACKLAVRTPGPLPIPPQASPRPVSPHPASAFSELTTRDVQRLVRECRYEISLMDKLAAALQSAQSLWPQAKFDRIIQVSPPVRPPTISDFEGRMRKGKTCAQSNERPLAGAERGGESRHEQPPVLLPGGVLDRRGQV